MPSAPGWSTTPAEPPRRAREGKRGTTLTPARPAHTPRHQLFGQATPGPEPSLRPPAPAVVRPSPKPPRKSPAEPLDTQRGLVMYPPDFTCWEGFGVLF